MTTDENLSMTPDNDKAPQRRKRPRKGPIVGILLLLFLLAGIGAGAWWYLFLRFEESTDDAYVAGNVLRIMPQVSGKVVAVDVDDNDMVAAGQTLAVTVFYRGINAMRTIGLIGGCSYAELGNCTRRPLLHLAIPMQHTAETGAYEVIPALTEIDVLAAPGTHACVIFGDSTVANELPRLLAARLRADGIENVSVTQAAIKGDRLVADGVGRAAKLLGGAGVKRFERDVLAQAGADTVLVKLGANDLIHPHCRSKQGLLTPVTFTQMTAGYRALADMAHAQGVRIWFCELTPWKGYTRNLFGRGDDIQWSPELDALRPELNAWFQSADCPADGYIPLDALADPDDPDALIPAYTTDGVHHTPAGQRALAALIPEDIFRAPQKEVSP